jgi:hypothetical protein
VSHYLITRVHINDKGRVDRATVLKLTPEQPEIGIDDGGGVGDLLESHEIANLIVGGDFVYVARRDPQTMALVPGDDVHVFGQDEDLESVDDDGQRTNSLRMLPRLV